MENSSSWLKRCSPLLAGVTLWGLLMACVNPTSTEQSATLKPGEHSVTRIEGAISRAISLGSITVNSTISVQFLIKNIGSYAINDTTIAPSVTGITLEADDFTITPNTIASMNPAEISGIEYTVTLTLNHGLVYGKIGTHNLLTGLTKVSLNISGTTSSDGVTFATPVSVDVEIDTQVNVADWRIQSSVDGVTWTDDTGSGNVSYMWSGTANDWRRIVNTGNVPIGYYEVNSSDIYDLSYYTIVPPGESLTIGKGYYIHIRTYGVMYDYSTHHPNPSTTTDFWAASIVNEFI